MQITDHVYSMHIDDGGVSHPGGSNNFFVGDPSESMLLIDAGDQHRRWVRAILDYHEELGKPKIDGILITHGHIDHIGGLDRVQEAIGAPVRCHPKLAEKLEDILGPDIVVPLKSREVLKTGGDVSVQALFTPGHEIDHVCYYIRSDKVMFTGDTVLGASSTSVRDLSSYMKSLEMLTRFKFDTICPAHGPVVPPPRGARLVDGYMSHRQQREQQVIDALAKGCDSVEDITKNMYPRNLKKGLVRTAQGNVRTHLEKLVKEGKASETASKYKLA